MLDSKFKSLLFGASFKNPILKNIIDNNLQSSNLYSILYKFKRYNVQRDNKFDYLTILRYEMNVKIFFSKSDKGNIKGTYFFNC